MKRNPLNVGTVSRWGIFVPLNRGKTEKQKCHRAFNHVKNRVEVLVGLRPVAAKFALAGSPTLY